VCQGPDEGSIKFAAIINFHESSNQDRDENQLSFIIKSTPNHVAKIIKCTSSARLLSFLSAGTNGMPYILTANLQGYNLLAELELSGYTA
jgi:hypothetical protein